MSVRVRCPSCQAVVQVGGPGTVECPECGKRLAVGTRRKTEDAKPAGAAASTEEADRAPEAEAKPPRERKRRRPRNDGQRFDFAGLVQGVGASVLLFAVSLGVAGLVRLVVPVSPPPEVAPAAVPAPAPAQGELAEDKPVAKHKPIVAVPVNGDPLFASGDGLFLVDTPWQGGKLIPALADHEGPTVPILDLTTGKPAGALPKEAPRGPGSLLSPDGRYLVAPVGSPKPGQPALEVWQAGAKQAAALDVSGQVLWLDFVSADQLAVVLYHEHRGHLQLWSVSKQELVRSFLLTAGVFPVGMRLDPTAPPNPLAGAVSPDRSILVVGGPHNAGGFTTNKGEFARGFSFPDQQDQVATTQVEYRGMCFSSDSSEVTGLAAITAAKKKRTLRLKTWKPDGTVVHDSELSEWLQSGPPLPGPSPHTVYLPGSSPVDGQPVPSWHVVDARRGEVVSRIPYVPVRWLPDGRLLVVGPIKDAPPGTPLPSALSPPPGEGDEAERQRRDWDEKHRKDPNVRAVYPVAVEQRSGQRGRATSFRFAHGRRAPTSDS